MSDSQNAFGKKFTPAKKCEYYVSRTDAVNFYLNSIKTYRVMSPEEELNCIKEYKDTHDISKRNLLVSCNQRYVYALAKRLTTDPDTIIDLVNEGNIGLIEAIDKYDMSFGTTNRNSLMMYASSYVMRNMLNFFIMNKTVSRKADIHMGSRISTEKNAFFAVHGRFPTDDELRDIFVEKYGKSFKDNYAIEQAVILSIDDKSPYDNDEDFNDSYEFAEHTSSENNYVKEIENDDIKAKILVALSNLRGRDKEIIEMLFGINGIEYSPEQIGLKFGLTKTRVLQIKRNALIKMRLTLTA